MRRSVVGTVVHVSEVAAEASSAEDVRFGGTEVVGPGRMGVADSFVKQDEAAEGAVHSNRSAEGFSDPEMLAMHVEDGGILHAHVWLATLPIRGCSAIEMQSFRVAHAVARVVKVAP